MNAAYVLHVLRNRGGFTVTHAADPQDALHQATAARWDLVLTDVEMPGMTGIELIGQLRDRAPQLPVAVLTAHPSVDYAVQALRNSADEFLEKTAAAEKFDAEIRDAVRYEKGLVVKALIALALVALVVLARLLYLA